MKFRLLAGGHSVILKQAVNPGDKVEYYTYHKDDVFESATDLELLNAPPATNLRKKFERVPDNTPVTPMTVRPTNSAPPYPLDSASSPQFNDALENMTIAELKQYAAEEEIDLGKASKKEEVIEVIRKAADALSKAR